MKERSQPARPLRRGRIAALAGIVLAAALAWLVAPALSSEPYTPEAVDFTMPIGGVEELDVAPSAERYAGGAAGHARGERRRPHGHEHGPVLYRTPPLKAPARFDLVGVAGGKGPFEYRVREDGGDWTVWAESDPGGPVYTGGSNYVQVRSRHVPIRGELHFVNVSGDSTAVGGLINRVRSAVNSAVIAALPVRAADAAAPKPRFISRKQWGANGRGGCKPRQRAEYGQVKAGVVHHTVSLNSYSEAEAPGMVLAICRFHRNGNGWNDIGYNALVDRFGNVYQGRAGGMRRPVVGAQAEGINAQTAGISAIGDYDKARPSKQTINGIVKYLAWRLSLEGIKATGKTRLISSGGSSQRTPKGKRMRVPRIFNHGFTNYTDCAGQYLNKMIPKIRKKVQRRIRQSAGNEEKPPKEDPGDEGHENPVPQVG